MNDVAVSAEGSPSRITRAPGLGAIGPGRPIVVVLGMHRSGTSLCSHILSALGIDMADVVSPDKGNDHGHWERWEIVGFHDRILECFNRGYYGSFHDFLLPPGWWAEPDVGRIRLPPTRGWQNA
ncbi:MAG: hypothetical protein ACREFB_07715 [Stellaceae bacterium]